MNNRLFERVRRRSIPVSHVSEIGVWHPETSNVLGFIRDGCRATLVEPDPGAAELIRNRFAESDRVVLHEVAVCDRTGDVELTRRESSTYLSTLSSSPALVNDRAAGDREDRITVRAVRMSDIDDGDIDLLSIDTEGSEWFVLKNLRSRPAVISVETHGGAYVNPHLQQIRDWMRREGYSLWYLDRSDSIYARSDVVVPGLAGSLRILLDRLLILLRRFRKRLKLRYRRWEILLHCLKIAVFAVFME